MKKQDKILVTGASGLIGSALVRLLVKEGYENILTPPHEELDLRQQTKVFQYFEHHSPDYVFHLAARVGGIKENSDNPADFCHDNTTMHCNVFLATNSCAVKKILFPGSACAYPRDIEQPIKESSFLQGIPEPTNLAYAIAKINGIVMAQSYAKQYGMNVVLPMVTNTYGIGDRSSHVIPMMIKRFYEKYASAMWGTGSPLREFIYADDVADAFLFLMQSYDSPDIINVGTKEEISIFDLAEKIFSLKKSDVTVTFDAAHTDGTPRKCLDSSKLHAMGWKPKVSLEQGLRRIIVNQ